MGKMNWLQNLLVGVLFFSALSVLGYFTIISESGPFARAGRQLVIFFDNAEGIKVGSRVTVLGVPLGKVVSIDLIDVDANNQPLLNQPERIVGQRVAITVDLRNPVVFYKNYSIDLKNESLLAGKVVSIDPGRANQKDSNEMLPPLPVLMVSYKLLLENDISALQYHLQMRRSGAIVDLQGASAGDPLGGLSELISENREDVRRTINNIAEITAKINYGEGTLGLLDNEDELHRNANTLVTDAQIVVRELRESMEDTREQAPVNSFIRAALTAF